MKVTPMNYTNLLRSTKLTEVLNMLSNPTEKQPDLKVFSPSAKTGSQDLTTLQSTAATLKEQVPSGKQPDPLITLALHLNRARSSRRNKSTPTRRTCQRLQMTKLISDCTTELPTDLIERSISQHKQIRRAIRNWPRGLIRAARKTKLHECK